MNIKRLQKAMRRYNSANTVVRALCSFRYAEGMNLPEGERSAMSTMAVIAETSRDEAKKDIMDAVSDKHVSGEICY
jgi:hypothetical protein